MGWEGFQNQLNLEKAVRKTGVSMRLERAFPSASRMAFLYLKTKEI